MTTWTAETVAQRIDIFADGADLRSIERDAGNPLIRGFTTNPTLMRKAGIDDYEDFAKAVLARVPDKPVSFEVISDEFAEMERQARRIASWAEHVFVKIPIMSTRRESAVGLIETLCRAGVKVNTTAVFSPTQLDQLHRTIPRDATAIVSVFAGRIADTGMDPVPIMRAAKDMFADHPDVRLLWASPREVLNVVQAAEAGVDIITLTDDLRGKLTSLGRDLEEFSRDTVAMFHEDAVASGYRL
ncbi:MAG: transaldolase [Alphaproteobacteria bacterium]|nr:transaldolase [Alphaproteobacteria bacterium]